VRLAEQREHEELGVLSVTASGATRRLTSDGGELRVLILTTFDLDEYVYEAMKIGASGFLLKDVPPERLADAVRVVAAGKPCSRPRSRGA
jgi:DNA-binding NarL/FixJ family response regulator